MERTKETIRRCFIIINIIIVGIFVYLIFNENNLTKEKINEKDKITKEYQVLMNDTSISEKEIDEVNKSIDELEHIDETVKNMKDEVFKLASELEKKIQNKESKMKIAYLTFDDGPYYNTYKVLNILKENHVKATFFTTNVNGTKCFDNKNYDCHKLYKEYAKANHTIANHTYTHGWNRGLYRSAESFMDAVKKQENLVKSETGLITNIVRFPGGSGTPGKTKGAAMKQALYKAGYGWVDWSANDGDGKGVSSLNEARSIFQKSIDNAIEVVLFHDYDQKTTKLLPEFIKYLKDRNYILLPLFYESVTINKK